jgi:hypothetical protein
MMASIVQPQLAVAGSHAQLWQLQGFPRGGIAYCSVERSFNELFRFRNNEANKASQYYTCDNREIQSLLVHRLR